MKKPGAIYVGRDGREYLAVYSYYDTSCILPQQLHAMRLANLTYSKGGHAGSVDVFALNEVNLAGVWEFVNIKKRFRLTADGCEVDRYISTAGESKNRFSEAELSGMDDFQKVHAQVTRDSGEAGDAALLAARYDILDFCGDEHVKNPESSVKRVDRIVSETKLRRLPSSVLVGENERRPQLLKSGKQEFVDKCILTANIDFGEGCITSWVPGEGASFDKSRGIFRNYFHFPWGECDYCYSARSHKHFPAAFYAFDQAQLIGELKGDCCLKFGSPEIFGKHVKFLRFGKRTESYTPFTDEEFRMTLEAMLIAGEGRKITHGIIPTKFLPFDREIAQLLKRTGSSVLYSIGLDGFELGACAWGRNNQWRIEQATKYYEEGVNSSLYLLMAAHAPPREREKAILKFAEEKNLSIQLLPFRFKTKELAMQIAGIDWDILLDKTHGGTQFDLLEEVDTECMKYRGSYNRVPNGIVPKVSRINPVWMKLVGDNNGRIRMCHHDSDCTLCGGCWQKKGVYCKNKKTELERKMPGWRRNRRLLNPKD